MMPVATGSIKIMSEPTDNMQQTEGSSSQGEGAKSKRSRPQPSRKPEVPPSDAQSARALEFLGDVVSQMGMACKVRLRGSKEDDDQEIRLRSPATMPGASSAKRARSWVHCSS